MGNMGGKPSRFGDSQCKRGTKVACSGNRERAGVAGGGESGRK